MAGPATPAREPQLLKPAFLSADESLLEETRASRWLYLPGPTVWTVAFLLLAYLTWAPSVGLPAVSAYRELLSGFASFATIDDATFRLLTTVVLLLLVAVGLLWLIVRFVRWTRTIYAVTDRRVLVQRGILGRDLEEIPVDQVRAVEVTQSFGHRLLGYGTVSVSSEGGSGALGRGDWPGIPRPFRFQKLIEDARAAARAPAGAARTPSG